MVLRYVPNSMQICCKWWLRITTINRGTRLEEFRSTQLACPVWHDLGCDRFMKQIILSVHTHDEAHLHKYSEAISGGWTNYLPVRWQQFIAHEEPSFPAHHRCKPPSSTIPCVIIHSPKSTGITLHRGIFIIPQRN